MPTHYILRLGGLVTTTRFPFHLCLRVACTNTQVRSWSCTGEKPPAKRRRSIPTISKLLKYLGITSTRKCQRRLAKPLAFGTRKPVLFSTGLWDPSCWNVEPADTFWQAVSFFLHYFCTDRLPVSVSQQRYVKFWFNNIKLLIMLTKKLYSQ